MDYWKGTADVIAIFRRLQCSEVSGRQIKASRYNSSIHVIAMIFDGGEKFSELMLGVLAGCLTFGGAFIFADY